MLAVNVDDVEQHSWNTGDAAGETKGVRDRAGRARTLKSENMTTLYCTVCWAQRVREKNADARIQIGVQYAYGLVR